MSNFKPPVSFKGKYVGILVITILQLLNGAIHTIIGGAFLVLNIGVMEYNVYTLFYGALNLVFLYGLWTGKKSGWIGTILVSIFVIVVDVCATLDIQLIPGVPKTVALGEIVISLTILVFLFQPKIRPQFLKTK